MYVDRAIGWGFVIVGNCDGPVKVGCVSERAACAGIKKISDIIAVWLGRPVGTAAVVTVATTIVADLGPFFFLKGAHATEDHVFTGTAGVGSPEML